MSKKAAGGDYPELGDNSKKPGQAQTKKTEDEDPCKGKNKEFFIYDFDAYQNCCICTEEQMKFIAIHFP